MLAGFIQLIHILVCVGLIVIVLLQADKGEGLAGAFGGGASSTVFGERGSGGFMSKLTTTMAIVFMITSLVIAVFIPRWEDASPAQYSAPAAAPMSVPGLPIQVPDTSAAPAAVTTEPAAAQAPIAPVTPVAPVAPAAVTAEPAAAPAAAPIAPAAESSVPAAAPAPGVN